MARTIFLSLTRTSTYEVQVEDDELDLSDPQAVADFADEAGQAETDDIVLNRITIFDAEDNVIYDDSED